MAFLQSFPKTEKDIHEDLAQQLSREKVARAEAERHDCRRLMKMQGPSGEVYGSLEAISALQAAMSDLASENEVLKSRLAVTG